MAATARVVDTPLAPVANRRNGAYLRTIYQKHFLALLALLAVIPALAACGAEDLAPASIAEAADATVAERGMRIALRQTLTIAGGERMSTSGTGVMDTHRQASHLTLKVTSAPDVVVGAFDKNDLVTQVITDHAIVYTHSPQLRQLLGGGRDWVKIDAAAVGKAAGIDVAAMTHAGQDPTQAMRQLKAVSGDVETVGREDVRGVATTHYRATVDLRRYPDLVSGAQRGAARASIGRLIAQTATGTVPVDIWIGADDLVRRVSQKLSLKTPGGPTVVEQHFEFYDFGTAVHIAVPAADEVTDVTDLAAPDTATQGP